MSLVGVGVGKIVQSFRIAGKGDLRYCVTMHEQSNLSMLIDKKTCFSPKAYADLVSRGSKPVGLEVGGVRVSFSGVGDPGTVLVLSE